MKSWNMLLKNCKKDFTLIKKELILFCIAYILLITINYFVSNYFLKIIITDPISLIPYFVFLFAYSGVFLVMQYFFQKSYSLKLNIPLNITNLRCYFLKIIQIYFVQFLIYIGILLLFTVVFIIIIILQTNLFKINFKDQMLFTQSITFLLIILGTVWFFRLFFVNAILLYSRTNRKNKIIIQESKYLVKSNISLILFLLFILAICMVPRMFINLNNYNIPIVSNILLIVNYVIGFLSCVAVMIITENEVIENKHLFLLEPKNEN